MTPRRIYQGTGPGAITPDGCAVDHYAMLTPNGEPERIHAAIPEKATILELGAGAGRITHSLLALGHEVVAVDESPEMLAHVKEAETVCSPIQSLSLHRTFDMVLLMSFVIETADDELRDAFLRTCYGHVAEDGCVILQRQPPEWYDTIQPFERDAGDGRTVRMRNVSRPEPGLLSAIMEYTVGERRWTHFFLSKRLEDDFLEESLNRADLTMSGFLDGDRGWVRAVPLHALGSEEQARGRSTNRTAPQASSNCCSASPSWSRSRPSPPSSRTASPTARPGGMWSSPNQGVFQKLITEDYFEMISEWVGEIWPLRNGRYWSRCLLNFFAVITVDVEAELPSRFGRLTDSRPTTGLGGVPSMGHDISALHHVGHVVRDMEEALERYRRLGFRLPPPSYPTMPAAAGEPPKPFGMANTHAYFPRNFVELVTVVGDDATGRIPADAHLIPLRVPDDKLPGLVAAVRGTAANLAACLQRFQGVHILMFDAPDIEGAAVRLGTNGVGHGGVHAVQRPVETVDGMWMEPVCYLEIDGHEPGTAAGRVPEGRIGLAENPASNVLDAQRHLDHPNGAVDLVECVLCVADAELPDVERRYETYLGRPARRNGLTRVFDLDGAKVTLIAASALADLLPGERAPALPAFVAYAVAVRDIAVTERLLRESGVPLEAMASGEIFVPAGAALGVAIIFRQAS